MYVELLQPSFVPPAVAGVPIRSRCNRLMAMLADIECAMSSGGAAAPRRVAAALKPHLSAPDLLDGADCPSSPDRYVRHLLHAGDTYTVLALVWRPGQMSPVHGHRAWGVVGVHQGWLAESLFVLENGRPRLHSCQTRRVGDILPPPKDAGGIHRIANLGIAEAISIHIYNTTYQRLGTGLNVIWAD